MIQLQSFSTQNEAKKFGCQQVLWLHGDDEQLTEMGSMSLFVYYINGNGGIFFLLGEFPLGPQDSGPLALCPIPLI